MTWLKLSRCLGPSSPMGLMSSFPFLWSHFRQNLKRDNLMKISQKLQKIEVGLLFLKKSNKCFFRRFTMTDFLKFRSRKIELNTVKWGKYSLSVAAYKSTYRLSYLSVVSKYSQALSGYFPVGAVFGYLISNNLYSQLLCQLCPHRTSIFQCAG